MHIAQLNQQYLIHCDNMQNYKLLNYYDSPMALDS